MDRTPTYRPARFQRRVSSILRIIPNSPTHRRDTIECKLDCGHTRSVLRVSRDHVPTLEQCKRLIGAELDCAKCLVIDRIRRKAVAPRKVRRASTGLAY